MSTPRARSYADLRAFLAVLEERGDLVTIDAEVDPTLELAEDLQKADADLVSLSERIDTTTAGVLERTWPAVWEPKR